MAAEHLSAIDSLLALAPLVGAGGISGVVIAILGYMHAARSGRPPAQMPQPAQVALATMYADQASIVKTAEALAGLAEAVSRAVELAERGAFLAKFDKLIGTLGTIAANGDKLVSAVDEKLGEQVGGLTQEMRELRHMIELDMVAAGRRTRGGS